MYTVISVDKIEIPLGSILKISGAWADYEALVKQLGDQCDRITLRRQSDIYVKS